MSITYKTLSLFNNKLLNRQELKVIVSHPNQLFKKTDLSELIKKKYNTDYVVIQRSKTAFGKSETRTNVRVYKDEDWYILMRAGIRKKDRESRRVRKYKRKRKVLTWGSVRKQEKKAERKQK